MTPADSIAATARVPSIHVYARAAALCASPSCNRRNLPTVSLEFAAADGAGGYAFDCKVQFQLSVGELSQVVAVLAFPGPSLVFTHRSSALKTLSIRGADDDVLLFSLDSPGRRFVVPVTPADQFLLRTFLLLRLAEILSAPPDVVLLSLRTLSQQLGRDPGRTRLPPYTV
jgi:hypothetical protein